MKTKYRSKSKRRHSAHVIEDSVFQRIYDEFNMISLLNAQYQATLCVAQESKSRSRR